MKGYGKKVLFIDDSEITRITGKKILTKQGFSVLQAVNGYDALKVFNNNLVDIVILDIHMPKVNGLEFLKTIRKNCHDEKRQHIPILVFSSDASPKTTKQLVNTGINEFLDKHKVLSTPELFLEKIYSILNIQEEVVHFKALKLKRTLSPFVTNIHTLIKMYVDLYLSKGEISKPYIVMMGKKIDEMIDYAKKEQFIELIYETPNLEDFFVSHSVNSCLLTIFFSLHSLGWEKKKIQHAAMGAVFHDFGYLDKSRMCLTNPCELVDKEFNKYKEHIPRGVNFGRRLGLSPEALDYIENHHEYTDGSGFPNEKKDTTLSDIAKIASLIDYFDSMTFSGTKHKKMVMNETINQMLENKEIFSASHLRKFIELLKQFDFKRSE